MQQVDKPYGIGDVFKLKGAGDELRSRLVGKEADSLLRDLFDQLQRMRPEDRVNYAAHEPDQVAHRLRALSRRLCDAQEEKLDFEGLYKIHEELASEFLILVSAALQVGAKF